MIWSYSATCKICVIFCTFNDGLSVQTAFININISDLGRGKYAYFSIKKNEHLTSFIFVIFNHSSRNTMPKYHSKYRATNVACCMYVIRGS